MPTPDLSQLQKRIVAPIRLQYIVLRPESHRGGFIFPPVMDIYEELAEASSRPDQQRLGTTLLA